MKTLILFFTLQISVPLFAYQGSEVTPKAEKQCRSSLNLMIAQAKFFGATQALNASDCANLEGELLAICRSDHETTVNRMDSALEAEIEDIMLSCFSGKQKE